MGRGNASTAVAIESGVVTQTSLTATTAYSLSSDTTWKNLTINASGLTSSSVINCSGVQNLVFDNVRITGLANTKTAFTFTNCQNVVIKNCVIESCGKGVTFDACDNVVVTDNLITVTADAGSGFTGHGVLFYANTAAHAGAVISGNHITGDRDYSHGIYGWGSDAAVLAGPTYASDIVIKGNNIQSAFGGIWFSKCKRVSVEGNVINDCGDVGIDFEGCLDCSATGNVVAEAERGALAALYNSKRVMFTGNTVTASTFTTLLGGAGHFAETSWMCAYVRDTCSDIDFVGNTFASTSASRFGEVNIWKNGETAASTRVSLRGNKFRNCGIFGLSQIKSIVVEGNDFYADFEPSSSVVEIDQSDGVVIRNNRFSLAADSTKNARGDSPIECYQNSVSTIIRTNNVLIEGNVLLNYPSVGIEVDTYNGTNYTAIFIIRNNVVANYWTRTSAAATKLISGNVNPTDPSSASTAGTW